MPTNRSSPAEKDVHTPCAVCGSTVGYDYRPVLWGELVAEWGLNAQERDEIDRQQGQRCKSCRCNLRSIALAKAFTAANRSEATLDAFLDVPEAARLQVLEVNEAGQLSSRLERLRGHTRGSYPDVDMTRLPYASEAFDIVIHSDTLEHIDDADAALRECRRVLRPGGTLVCTVPVVVGRLTRSRRGLPPSYHGASTVRLEEMRVHWEFGSDVWCRFLHAGFSCVAFHGLTNLPALSISAQR